MSARKNFSVRLDAREEAHIKAEAARAGLSMAQFARRAMLGSNAPEVAQEQRLAVLVDRMEIILGGAGGAAGNDLNELRLTDEAAR